MKEIIRITIGLTITCLVAALVMGTVFAVTDAAKKHNEHVNVQDTMLGLLGYNQSNPRPTDLSLFTIYRYILEEGNKQYLGYLVPVVAKDKETHEFLTMDLEGKFVDRLPVDLTPEAAAEVPNRTSALKKALKSSTAFSYANATIIATLGDKRLAYVLPGEFPGFKTFIKVMLAVEPDFDILGLEIMEHEEDPGLGGEIEQHYFKDQFQGKTFSVLKALKVVKEPLPDEYRLVLESANSSKNPDSNKESESIRAKYFDDDIYALTGATISSRAVTGGVKNMVKKFAYRFKTLDAVIAAQGLPVAF